MSSKLEALRKSAGGNAMASAGVGRFHHEAAPDAAPTPDRWRGADRTRSVLEIDLDRIEPDPDQPRTEFDQEELRQLADSLKARGQLQPVRVRWDEGRGAYLVVTGERRWRAAMMAGLPRLTCVLHAEATPEDLLEDQLVENCVRADLKPIEQARAYAKLMAVRGISQRDLAERLHVSPASVARAVRLLDLPEAVQEAVDQGDVPAATAYQIAQVPDPVAQAQLATLAASEGLTGAEMAEMVKAVRARRPAASPRPEPVAFDLGEVTVKLTWKKAGPTAVQALRRALKEAQAQERGESDAA